MRATSGDGPPNLRPLGPGDPGRLGAYRLVARLGQGGMGTVYLAETPDGRPVALKVIRGELADDAEFRRRFRGEVARARQVPPFCTAEVLDADTEHDPPYLVVEYVNGPSLATVVAQQGPFSPANQHGLAVGVAVALTAIHGAGVIHRDLKPGNVLLAPGSPKVIDFGIARGMATTDAGTEANQVMGTVAYMAPERFGGAAEITPAADIFSWGAVIAYAAAGHPPFGADTPAALAMRIMTQPPDLGGVGGPLRYLVEQALSKDPARRPSARQLVDHLLTGGIQLAARSAAFAAQPEVLAAAGITPTLVSPPPHGGAHPQTVRYPNAGVHPQAGRYPPAGRYPAGPHPDWPHSTPTLPHARPRTRDVPVRSSGRGRRVAIAAVSVLVLVAAVAGILTGVVPVPGLGGATAGGSSAAPSGSTPSSAGPSSAGEDGRAWVAPGSKLVVKDPLSSPGAWKDSALAPYQATCEMKGQLRVTLGRRTAGSYRCRGIEDPLTDFTVVVDTILNNANSCAGVWFRFDGTAGYALRVCRDRYELMTHIDPVLTLRRTFLVQPTAVGAPIRVAVKASGSTLSFYNDDALVGEVTDETFAEGWATVGVFPLDNKADEPYAVTFFNIELWRGPGPGASPSRRS